MKTTSKIVSLTIILLLIFTTGCANLVPGHSQVQKQNAWLHYRTSALVAETAKAENGSENLIKLASLSNLQSNAFLADYGLPDNPAPIETSEDALSQTNQDIAKAATQNNGSQNNIWDVADGVIKTAIAVASLFGGAYGIKFAGYLKQAGDKSQALREIIQGNEVLKSSSDSVAAAFKDAHQNQSAQTKQIVAQIKNAQA